MHDDRMFQYNRSMIAEASLSGVQKVRKRFSVQFTDSPEVFAPVGHVYSVMVEEMDITNPSISEFIAEINTYIEKSGESHVKIISPRDHFSNKRMCGLVTMLGVHMQNGRIKTDTAYRIVRAAVGDHDFSGWTEQFQ